MPLVLKCSFDVNQKPRTERDLRAEAITFAEDPWLMFEATASLGHFQETPEKDGARGL